MASTRDIRRRIKSVKNTRQITKAMELVAASKMKKAQAAAVAGRPYAVLMSDMLAALASKVDGTLHPFLQPREVKTRGILLVTTDKGLCGPLNANLFKLVSDIKDDAKFVVVGRKGSQFLARSKRNVIADFGLHDKVPFHEIKVIGDHMIELFLQGEIDTIEVIYPRFKNTLIQEPTHRPILPLDNLRDFVKTLADEGAEERAKELADDRQMIFEPDAQTVLEALLPFYVNRYLYQLALSTKASEHSARMVAMKTAKDNASNLLDDLTLEYNKARQAAITQEILEIAAAQFSA
ncbi:ATP synthase F1 subunit gamma [Synoicihabitans lomoniglobus]|uniref:ATP synthase gamma chain n=1 Tax=Synoicihabitans lomoniglobus TaxID=2909285 RepID=A0AAE9ZWK7_9BACT|nr:ATP synthase F1 subunit gamma [Opitutaceae bacterium LMO-M01]WED64524.1 ATP synthase F1 subunit gamma [Opitutaceae bacterium LMO-M01]